MKREKLSSLVEISIGRTPSRSQPAYWGKGHKWVSIRDLNSKVITETKEQITDLAVEATNCRLVPKGTLLFSFKLTIGKMAFAGTDLFTNEAIAAFSIKDKKRLTPDYLYLALLAARYGGSNQAVMGKTLNSKSLAQIEIPLPSLDEQIRITRLLGSVEGLIAQRKQQLRQFDELLKGVFWAMFGDPVKNELGWNVVPFPEVGKFISGGTPSKDREDYWNGNFPWVSPKDMKVSKIADAMDHISEKALEETSLKRIAPGHLLIVVRGMILAHSFPLAINAVEVAINQDMKAIALRKGWNVTFILHCLVGLKRKILKLISTAGHGTRKFDAVAMQDLFIPEPPEALQIQFASVAERIERVKLGIHQSLIDLEALYGALSQRAFNGELDLSRVPLTAIETAPQRDTLATASVFATTAPPVPVNALAPPEDGYPELEPSEDERRQALLAHWLQEYLAKTAPYSAMGSAQFLDGAWHALSAHRLDVDGDATAHTLEDYEALKEMVFHALVSCEVIQDHDDDGNRVTLGKGPKIQGH